jgi:O-antigen/teichoic acid export membrane protein
MSTFVRLMRPLLAHPGFWSITQQVGRQLAAYGIFLLLGALLRPGDFGVVALASTAIALMSIFADLGVGAALVQRRDLTGDQVNAVFALNVAASTALAALAAALSWPLASAFRTPVLQPVLLALAPGILLNGLGLTQMALAQRALRFRDLALRDLVGTLSGGVVGVVMALRGLGVWSLVAQTLVTALVSTALLWRLSPWRPSLRAPVRAALAELWPYSSGILSFSILKFFTQNSDTMLVGWLMGPVLLGYYNFASKVTITPVSLLVGAVGSYLFASFSRLQGDRDSLRRSYLRYSEVLLTAALPALTALACLGPSLLPLALGERWKPIGPLVPLFCGAAAVLVLISPVGSVLKAVGRVRWLVAWSAFFTSAILLLVGAGSRWGIVGVATGYALAHLTAATVAAVVLQRSIGVTPRQLLGPMRRGLVLSAIVGGSVALVWLVPGLSPPAHAALWLLVGGAASVFYLRRVGVGEVGRAIENWRRAAAKPL